MDAERIYREAMEFSKDDCCFIHAECKDGHQEACIVGDGGAVIRSLASIMGQLANSCQ